VTFLNHIGVGGRVMNHASSGGYLRWTLYPTYQIWMDLEVPFLFHDSDLAMNRQAFVDRETLRRVLTKYDPPFIAVPMNLVQFRDTIRAFPDYRPVFFDDAAVLYLNRRHHPAIAEQYELKGKLGEVSPLAIRLLMEAGNFDGLKESILRIAQIYPQAQIVNHAASAIYLQEGAYDVALRYAETMIQHSPESPDGYWLKAEALRGLGAMAEALSAEQEGARKQKRRSRFNFSTPHVKPRRA